MCLIKCDLDLCVTVFRSAGKTAGRLDQDAKQLGVQTNRENSWANIISDSADDVCIQTYASSIFPVYVSWNGFFFNFDVTPDVLHKKVTDR